MKRFEAQKAYLVCMVILTVFISLLSGCGGGGGGVWNEPKVTIVSLEVTPSSAAIPVNGNQQFTATARYSDGSARNVTSVSGIAWSSVDIAPGVGVALVGSGTGLATGKALGASTITATFGGLVSNSATLTVVNKTLISILVKPATASIPVNGTQQFAVIATWSDQTSSDVTTDPTLVWTNLPVGGGAAVASLSLPGVGAGLATGLLIGQTDINATYSINGVTKTGPTAARLTVVNKTLISILVKPATASIPVNGTQQFAVIATWSDQTSSDVTIDPTLVWTNLPVGGGAAVASLSPSGVGAGLATGLLIGQTDINATYTINGVTKTGPTAARLTVTAVAPPPPSPLGSASTYGLIAASAMTISSIPQTHIYGDVALTNNDAFTGFAFGGTILNPTSPYVTPRTIPGINSTVRGSVAAAAQAKIDLVAAYADLSSRAPTTTYAAGAKQLSGLVLTPGVYRVGAAVAGDTFALDNSLGPLVLDALGNPDAVFVLQASDITTTTGSVLLQGGAKPNNVYWVMTATATIGNGSGTVFQGTVVAGLAITVNGANVQGRMLAGASGTGALVISAAGGVITVPVP
jgi:hypothetical protein